MDSGKEVVSVGLIPLTSFYFSGGLYDSYKYYYLSIHMKKYIFAAVLSLGLLVSPALTHAASLTSAQVQAILGLLTSFGADSSVIANVQTSLTGGTPSSGGSTQPAQPFCYAFRMELGTGSNGNDVQKLNQALTASGINTSNNSSDFDENTAADVVAFQAKYGIRQTGYVGPKTLAKLNELYFCRVGPPTPVTHESIQVNIPSLRGGNMLDSGKEYSLSWTGGYSDADKYDGYQVTLMPVKDVKQNAGFDLKDIYLGQAYQFKRTFNFVIPSSVSSGRYVLDFRMKGGGPGSSEQFDVGNTSISDSLISIDTDFCTIPVGGNQCGAKISWALTSATSMRGGFVAGATQFIVSGGFNYTLTQDSYPLTTFMNKAGENTTTYTLKNNGVLLDTKTVTSKCVLGSSWNGSVCVAAVTTAPTISSLNPSYGPAGTTVTMTGSGFTATGNKIKFGDLGVEASPNYSVNSTDGRTITFMVPTTNYMRCWDAIPRCLAPMMAITAGTFMVSVTNANGTSNALPFTVGNSTPVSTPTATFTISGGNQTNVHNITYPVGTLNTKSWSSTGGATYSAKYSRIGNCTNTRVVDADWTSYINPPTAVGSAANGSNTNGIANAGDVGCVVSLTYTVTNSAGVSASDTIYVTVVAAPVSLISIDTSSCTIPIGGNQCGAKISWALTSATPGFVAGATQFIVSGGFNYTLTQDSYPLTTFMNKAGENTTTYTLKNNGQLLDTKTVTSKCAFGSTWNGSICS
jgi:peptidoglycan hydrolase-like protein with peptidoglycan-binding domain